jgi:RimJ/RimL family protein N-acetyltransferase
METNLKLTVNTLEQVRAMVEALSPADKLELSPDWLAKLGAATEADPWMHGFSVTLPATGAVVGTAGFKGPPDGDGIVEIAYGIDAEYRGKGYASEAAKALTVYAFGSGLVRTVRAHTKPDSDASKRVLTKCGFRYVGEVMDPEDGLVWRWEKQKDTEEGNGPPLCCP